MTKDNAGSGLAPFPAFRSLLSSSSRENLMRTYQTAEKQPPSMSLRLRRFVLMLLLLWRRPFLLLFRLARLRTLLLRLRPLLLPVAELLRFVLLLLLVALLYWRRGFHQRLPIII